MVNEEFLNFDEEEESNQSESPPTLVSALLCSIFSFLFTIGCCYFAIFSISFRKGISDSSRNFKESDNSCEDFYPLKYSVNYSFIYPINKNSEFGENLDIFSGIIFLLESQFRIIADELNIFSFTEFLSFSSKTFFNPILKFYNITLTYFNNNYDKILNKNLILGSPLTFLNISKNSYLSAIPTFLNNNLTLINPILFKLNNIKIMRGINSIKQSLIKSGRPLIFSFKYPLQIYYFDCNSQKNCKICNDSQLNCFKYKIPTLEIFNNIEYDYNNGPLVIYSIIGYNDNFLYPYKNFESNGGFILRGSTNNYFSYKYLFDEIDINQEINLYNFLNFPNNWKINLELLCNNDNFCNKSSKYFLISNFLEINNGFYKAKFLEISNFNYTHEIGPFPFQLFQSIFLPLNNLNSSYHCGYHFLSYSTYEKMLTHSMNLFTPQAFDVLFKWHEKTFEMNENLNFFNYLKKYIDTYINISINFSYDQFIDDFILLILFVIVFFFFFDMSIIDFNDIKNEEEKKKHIHFMKMALKVANDTFDDGEVAVGCIIVHNDEIIAIGGNQTNKENSAIFHAELVAFNSIPDKQHLLKDSILYVTVEPCIMCASAIKMMGIPLVVYGCPNERFGGCGSVFEMNTNEFLPTLNNYNCIKGVLAEESISTLKKFYGRANPKTHFTSI